MTSILKVDNIKDSADNQAISISGGVATFNNLPVNASAAGTAGFAARFAGSGWATAGDGVIIPYDNASTGDSFNTDSVYNTSTYKFTAPATGVYTFWYSVYTANGDADNGFSFLKNAARVNFMVSANQYFSYISVETGDHIQSATAVIPLESGDTLAHCAAGASADYHKSLSMWGGCRLA
jgi:hypothetical protein